jgi:hypothetical protein
MQVSIERSLECTNYACGIGMIVGLFILSHFASAPSRIAQGLYSEKLEISIQFRQASCKNLCKMI